jgi:hypothetical protein
MISVKQKADPYHEILNQKEGKINCMKGKQKNYLAQTIQLKNLG